MLFQIQSGESGTALTNVMANGFAGVVHFTPGCDIKAMIVIKILFNFKIYKIDVRYLPYCLNC